LLRPWIQSIPHYLKVRVSKTKFPEIGEQWLPTHTFNNAPELDILLISNGMGTRDQTNVNDIALFINKAVNHNIDQLKVLIDCKRHYRDNHELRVFLTFAL
jgi:hypothetical protein